MFSDHALTCRIKVYEEIINVRHIGNKRWGGSEMRKNISQ